MTIINLNEARIEALKDLIEKLEKQLAELKTDIAIINVRLKVLEFNE